MKKFCD